MDSSCHASTFLTVRSHDLDTLMTSLKENTSPFTCFACLHDFVRP